MGNDQHGALSHSQALAAGFTRSAIEANLKSGRWQRLYRGIYVAHNGPIPRMARVWAVLVAAGRGAALSHLTAAELAGLCEPVTPTVHVTIPGERRITSLSGARIHHSNRLDMARHPTKSPAQTRVEETVLDLADMARSVDEANHWLAVACGRRLTTPARLMNTLDQRKRIRWRHELISALEDVADGNHSILELRYFRWVERAHGLPAGKRQAPHQRVGGRIYDDVWYPAFRTVVELDGRVAHPADARYRDRRRDNVASIRGDAVLHYGWSDVVAAPCNTAMEVAAVLRSRGWTGVVRRCGLDCMIRKG